jgi:hypothetical protein
MQAMTLPPTMGPAMGRLLSNHRRQLQQRQAKLLLLQLSLQHQHRKQLQHLLQHQHRRQRSRYRCRWFPYLKGLQRRQCRLQQQPRHVMQQSMRPRVMEQEVGQEMPSGSQKCPLTSSPIFRSGMCCTAAVISLLSYVDSVLLTCACWQWCSLHMLLQVATYGSCLLHRSTSCVCRLNSCD